MRQRRVLSGWACSVLAVTALASCSNDADAIGFCDAAAGVREANLALADTLGSAVGWDDKQSDVADQLAELEDALATATDAEDQPVADELQLWQSDMSALRDRLDETRSLEDLLYAEVSDRPAPDQLNPALERVDATFEGECGFRARA